MNRIQNNNRNIGSYRINKISLSSYDDKKYLLRDAYIVGYHIFINRLVNLIKNSFLKYRQFILVFVLVRTATLLKKFFYTVKI